MNELKTVYRHVHVDKRTVTTCLLFNKGNEAVACGIAVRSPQDQYNRKLGNLIAFNRAQKAYAEDTLVHPVGNGIARIIGAGCLGYCIKDVEWVQ